MIEDLKDVREALELFRVSDNGAYCEIARSAKPDLFDGMDGDIPFAYRHPKEGFRDIKDAMIADNARKLALAKLDGIIKRLEAESPVFYKHYKGGYYKLLGFGKHESTGERMVMYKSVTDYDVWVRPEEEFHQKFTKVQGVNE